MDSTQTVRTITHTWDLSIFENNYWVEVPNTYGTIFTSYVVKAHGTRDVYGRIVCNDKKIEAHVTLYQYKSMALGKGSYKYLELEREFEVIVPGPDIPEEVFSWQSVDEGKGLAAERFIPSSEEWQYAKNNNLPLNYYFTIKDQLSNVKFLLRMPSNVTKFFGEFYLPDDDVFSDWDIPYYGGRSAEFYNFFNVDDANNDRPIRYLHLCHYAENYASLDQKQHFMFSLKSEANDDIFNLEEELKRSEEA